MTTPANPIVAGGTDTVDSLATQIKQAKPAYSSWDNRQLVRQWIEKYPVYQNRLKTEELQNLQPPPVDTTHRQGTTGVLGVLSGVGGEAIETVQGAKNLANYLLPKSLQIPDIPKEYRENTSTAEKIGGGIENIGEYAAGEALLKRLTFMARVPPPLLALANRYPKAAAMLETLEQAAVVGGAQGGVKGAAQGDAAGGAAAGAKGAMIGGAVGEGIGAVLRPVGRALGIYTTAEQDAMRAMQPGKRNYQFLSDWKLVKDRLKAELETGGRFNDMQDAADRIRGVRQNLWNNEVVPVIQDPRFANRILDPRIVSTAIRKRITPEMVQFAPEQARALKEFALNFRQMYFRPMTLGDAEGILEHFNAELGDAGFYKKTPMERAAAIRVNGALSGREAAVTSLRDMIYTDLENAGAPGMAKLKKTYGAMKNIENEVRGRVNVAGRGVPVSLKQVIGLAYGLAHGGPGGVAAAAMPILDRIYNAPEALLNRAVLKGTPGPLRRTVSAAITPISKSLPPAIGALSNREAEQ